MVEKEDYDMLRDIGTATLVRMLSSDIEQGITTTKRDIDGHFQTDIVKAPDTRLSSLAERRSIYGENDTLAWDIRQSIFEAWSPVASSGFFAPYVS
jgi:hypothetical protein